MAKKLAKAHGVDEKKAYVAGILHDIAKEMYFREQLDVLSGINFFPTNYSTKTYRVFHGFVGSIYAKRKFKIDDEDILNAIRYHTTGRKNMSMLEKVVYNADCISMDRKFEGIEYFRKVAMVDLNVVIIDKTSKAMQNSLRKQKPILIDTLEAYNDLVDKI